MICACRCVRWNSGDQARMSMKQYLKFEIVLEMKTQTAQLKALLDHLWFCRSMYSHRQTAVTALSISNWIGQRNYKLKVNSGLEVEEEGCLEFLFSVLKTMVFSLVSLCIYFSKFFSFMHDHFCGWAPQFLRIQFVILTFITVKGQFLVALTSHNTTNFAFISCFCIPLQEQSGDQERLCKASQSPVSKTVLRDVEKVSWSNSQQFSSPDKFPRGRGNK